ncbi:MAG: V-type ATP synthase subunit F [Spirochaetota bacterium]
MKYFVIGDEDTVLGFDLAGVGGRVARGAGEAQEAFSSALDDPDIGILVITERTADLIRTAVDRHQFTERFPLVVEIPDREGPLEGRPGIREMVNAAIGVKL